MAKTPEHETARTDSVLEQTAADIGATLGNLLNRVEHQWKTVRGQRDAVITSLRAIRDKANTLLAEAGDIQLPVPAIFKRHGRSKRAKGKKTQGSAVPPSVKRSGGPLSKKTSGVSATESAAGQTTRSAKRKGAKRGDRGGS